MTLQEFLSLIADEEARIELEIESTNEDGYSYSSFWLSDFRVALDTNKYYKDWKVKYISFMPEQDNKSDILIHILK